MINYIILGLLIVLLIVVIILIFKIKDRDSDNLDMLERLNRFEVNINKELNDNFIKMNENMESKLNNINEKVHERIDQNFEKTNKTFISVLERLSKIDEAQKKIDGLTTNIVNLEGILTDKKTRGIFGEVNLNNILYNVFGEGNDRLFKIQYHLPNDTIADSVVFAPEPLGMIAIDSKFPLENYRLMVDKKKSDDIRNNAYKQFKIDVKKHIDAISSKYIIDGVTSNQAIMFIPAEAIFAEINAYHEDIINYAYKKHVWLTSPTTLISTLSMIMMIYQNMERDKYTSIIHEELNKLGIEFTRFKDRFDKLSKSIQTVNKDVESFQVTTDKIKKKFDSISNVEIKNDHLLMDDVDENI
ncbi:MAG: DNA recombination protein RmuC [Bacilli bacterium]|nr:DNA recombination protein RmuC [Bacilli bacterium]